jgi:hypothetical protein
MKTFPALVFLIITPMMAWAQPKEFTILGGQRIQAEVSWGGWPELAKKDGIQIMVADYLGNSGKLWAHFSFTSILDLKSVLVEDVSGRLAVPMAKADGLKLKKTDHGYIWHGDSLSQAITRFNVPWIFERGTSTKVFRFTLTLASGDSPTVIYQPSFYNEDQKKRWQPLTR